MTLIEDRYPSRGRLRHSSRDGELPVVVRVLVYGYFLMEPVYLWSSGVPQVADGILVLLVALRVAARLKNGPHSHPEVFGFPSAVLCFAFYVAIVNLTAAILVGDLSFLQTTAFYVYNAAVAVTVFGLAQQYGAKLRSAVYHAAVLSVTVQVVALAVQGGLAGGGRQTAGFNNPNQLGAFAVLAYTVILATAGSSRIQAMLAGAMLPVVTLLILASLSRAAMLTLPILALSYVFYLRKSDLSNLDRRRTLMTVSVILLGGWLLVRDRISSGLFGAVDARWGVQKADNTLSGRGYDRIVDHPEFWLTGGGEGANYRFGVRIELHSGPGTLIYAYGAIGVVLFSAILFYAMNRNGMFGLLVLLAPLVYGLTHQVLRTTLLWILLALLAAFARRLQTASNVWTPSLSNTGGPTQVGAASIRLKL